MRKYTLIFAMLLFVSMSAHAAMLNDTYATERLLRADVIALCPESLEPTLEVALLGAKGVDASIEALGVLAGSMEFPEEIRGLFALQRIALLMQANRCSEMFEASQALLPSMSPGEDRLALCVFLIDKLGKKSYEQLPMPWEARAEWIELLNRAVLEEYEQFDREIVEAVMAGAEAMDQVAHRYHLELSKQLDGASGRAYLDIVLRATLVKRDYVARAQTILKDAERITAQVAIGSKTAREGRFSQEEAQEKLRGINQRAEGYATTLSSCEAKRAVVAADIVALGNS